MQQFILVIHLMLAIALVAVVLLQKSEGGGLGIGGGGGGGGMSGFMTGRGQANLLTRLTAILAAAFMATSLLMAWLAGYDRGPRSILDEPVAPAAAPAPAAPAPEEPAVPSVPLGQ